MSAAKVREDALSLAERLKEAIADGRYAPGQRLVEAEITRDWGASRAHVREALRRLSAEGLVEIEPFRGAIVSQPTRQELDAAGRVREALEGLAARLLAETALDEAQRGELQTIRARLSASAEAHDYPGYAAANEALHAFIIQECGNPYLASFLERLRLLVRRTQHMAAFREDRFLEGNVEHLAIIDAILLGSGEVAEALMRLHVRKGTTMIDDSLGGSGS